MPLTHCECTAPGHCPRHRCVKTPHWHHLCQTRPDYYQLWEEGQGPGQDLPPPRPARTDSQHRGGSVREAVCPSCQGLVRLKVFACTVHTECTLARALGTRACCATCSDYTVSEAVLEQAAAASPTKELS